MWAQNLFPKQCTPDLLAAAEKMGGTAQVKVGVQFLEALCGCFAVRSRSRSRSRLCVCVCCVEVCVCECVCV